MILSRTMRQSDFEELRPELGFVDKITQVCGGWRPEQHLCRRWEYALAYRAFEEWVGEKFPGQLVHVADIGAGIGLWAPMVLALGHDVVLMEQWVYGNWQEIADTQCKAVKGAYPNTTRGWRWETSVGLGALNGWGKEQFHAAFCISTLEHIGEEEKAFRDLLSIVRQDGLVFLTMDYAGDGDDRQYELAEMRCRMYSEGLLATLVNLACREGFRLWGGQSEWLWSEEHRLVNSYGFASLVLVKDESLGGRRSESQVCTNSSKLGL